jgi:hypothetical protein
MMDPPSPLLISKMTDNLYLNLIQLDIPKAGLAVNTICCDLRFHVSAPEQRMLENCHVTSPNVSL